MKKTYLLAISSLCCLFVIGQKPQTNYNMRWKEIDSLITKKGLTESAISKVRYLSQSAVAEKNEAEHLKALIYTIKLQSIKQEPADKFVISELEKELPLSQGASQAILNNLLAQAYLNYFQAHRFELYGRLKTEKLPLDISTWTIDDFHRKISQLFESSLKDENNLQQIKLEAYEPIIIKGNVRYLRPTLFDLLGHAALDYFKSDEHDLTRPAYAFELSDSSVFLDASKFVRHRFISADSLSLQFQALQLFQRLLAFHLHDSMPDALLDVDIERLVFANQYAVLSDKDQRFFKALQAISNHYPNEPSASEAWYLQAAIWAASAEKYNPLGDSSNRYDYLNAKKICEKLLAQPDSSAAKSNAAQLLQSILRREFQLQSEKVNIPNRPFRSLLSFRNVERLYFRIVATDHRKNLQIGQNQWDDHYWKALLDLPAMRTFSQTLPNTGDHQSHSMEIKIDSLPAGAYLLLLSSDPDFHFLKSPVAAQYFYVSRISYLKNENDYFVLDRESGHPLPGTTVQAWYKYYDNSRRQYMERRGEQFNTDPNGFFHLEPSRNTRNNTLLLEFTNGEDHYFPDSEGDVISSFYVEPDKGFQAKDSSTYFFTDRAIYRPGQTLYFKGIVITNDRDNHSQILSALKTKVVLYDANDERIDSATLLTNDFGSYHGSFQIPSGKLNGRFRLADELTGKDISFSVEEYKRPSFFVAYDNLKKSVRVMDTVRLSGSAKAYSGYPIDGANYTFSVKRAFRFPYPWLGGYLRSRSQSSQEIAHGSGKTDAEGNFSISFLALPDVTIKKEDDPVFNYDINIDITDANGETRSQEQTISAGYKSIILTLQWPKGKSIPADQFRNITVDAETLNGASISRSVKISIVSIEAPARLIRERLWKQPDLFMMTQQDYLQFFPNDEYSHESESKYWPAMDKVAEFMDSSSSAKLITLPGRNFQPGWYVVEASTTDEYGKPVMDKSYIELLDPKTGAPPSPRYDWIRNETQTSQPGEKATVHLGTSAMDVFVIREFERTNEIPPAKKYSFLTLNKEGKPFGYTVKESDRGGFGETHAFVKDNRFYSGSHTVEVPWTNKQLKIKYVSFRDKTLPGAHETWKINISGYDKDRAAAEMLTAMYDLSLDQFQKQYWEQPAINPIFYLRSNWNDQGNFRGQISFERRPPEYYKSFIAKNYDQLIVLSDSYEHPRFSIRMPMVEIQRYKSMAPGAAPAAFSQMDSSSFAFEQSGDAYVLGEKITQNKNQVQDPQSTQIRTNFNETAFFLPDLKTDSTGDIQFSFEMPEALTQWKWMSLAHTRNLDFGYSEATVVTQKQLMVEANAPRFLREGDRIEFSAKLINLTDSERSGQIQLQLIDPVNDESVDGAFNNIQPNQFFTVGAKQSSIAHFSIQVPFQYNRLVSYRIVASSETQGNLPAISDGEEASIPVISSMQLVTETLPLLLNNTGRKDFRFNALLNSTSDETLQNHSLTVEFSSNPSWYAVEALPYLIEFPFECAEQNFNRFYANSISSGIAASLPGIRQVLMNYKSYDSAEKISNLEKNAELKSVLLEETPWVTEAKSETEQKQKLIRLLDAERIKADLSSSLNKLAGMQSGSGGFPWFPGGRDDRYITQYILTGIGHLIKIGMVSASQNQKIQVIVSKALNFLDQTIKEEYKLNLERNKRKIAGGFVPGSEQLQYLYMRSFFPNYPLNADVLPAVSYFRSQAKQDWVSQSRMLQGMIALALYRNGNVQTASDILKSLREQAIMVTDEGMHWKESGPAYYWQQSPIETQSVLIEAFEEIAHDSKAVQAMQTWILLQKQTQNWKTTRATADACYALLIPGSADLAYRPDVQIQLGNFLIRKSGIQTIAGTGYFKEVIAAEKIKPGMGSIAVQLNPPPESLAWGAVYWQYFQEMDKIKSAASSLQVSRKLFVERNTDRGKLLEELKDNADLKVGDKLVVRLQVSTNADMDYVQLKDLRASCTEPQQALSGYQWQSGLGFYETIKDASVYFFFDRLPRGSYVFEYPLFVTHAGDFSAGISTLQCLYAPEFSAHSEGIRIHVD